MIADRTLATAYLTNITETSVGDVVGRELVGERSGHASCRWGEDVPDCNTYALLQV